MKLRKVQIVGFKSFRNRTGVEVGDGITAVIGPNGCGKSNIVDAVRWAMGSQSPRDLRGNAMEDVIFAGSSELKPAGFAEVSLLFENDPETSELPLEYRDKDTIEVTRRLYRTGESDYEINKSRARLRDIQQVFAGTGVGARDAYSIIEQGRIGFVVSAKAEDRRVIIEEAAGITRYRRQRKTAERRLSKTRDNLLRVRDVLAEVNRQLGRLERDAAKAAEVRALNEELRTAELAVATRRYKQVDERLKAAAALQIKAKEANDAAAVAMVSAEANVSTARAQIVEVEEANNEASEAAYRARARVDLLKSSLEHIEKQKTELEERMKSLTDSAALEQERSESEGGRLHEAKQRLEQVVVDREKTSLALREARKAVEAAADNHRAMASEMSALNRQLSDAERAWTRARTRREALSEELAAAGGRQRALQDETNEAEIRRDKLQTKVDELSTEATAASVAETEGAAALKLVTEREQATRQELARANDAHRQAQKNLTSLETRAEALSSAINAGNSLGPGARRALEASRRGDLPPILGSVAERLDVEKDAIPWVSTVLGDLMEALIVDSRQSAHAVVAWARNTGQSIVVAVDGAGQPDIETSGVRATGQLPDLVARRLTQFRRSAQFDRGSSVGHDQFGDDVASGGGSYATDDRVLAEDETVFVVRTGGSAAEKVLENTRELEQLRAELERARNTAAELDAQRVALEERRENLLQERIASQEELTSRQQRSRAAKAAHDEAMAQARRARDAASRIGEEMDRLSARADTIREEFDALEAKIESHANERDRLAADLDARTNQESEARGEREKADELFNNARVSDAGLSERQRSLEESVRNLKRSMATSSERVAQAQRALTESRERRVRLDLEHREREDELASAKRGAETAERDAGAARERFEAMSTDVRESEVALAERRRDAADAQKTLQQAELEQERARGEVNRAAESITDRFRMPLPEALREGGAIAWRPDYSNKIEKLRRRIERIGPVNPAAEEVFTEARERQEFLSEQKDDLEAAMSDLETAIRKMDKTSRQLFRETYERVNEGFQKMFPRLFNGGRARLELTDPDDLLGTGIEIICQPPGKRVQNMSLLSGGEKALTAVALVFAIFQLKPTPFCILDEVDAPLDEANVGRFSDMVREISASSQFLIITHNTRTMESADTLYGVTMEQPGVSRLVGVKLRNGEVRTVDDGTSVSLVDGN